MEDFYKMNCNMEILKWPTLKIQICEQLDIHMQEKKKKNLDTDLTILTKTHSKWIMDLKVKQTYKTPRR